MGFALAFAAGLPFFSAAHASPADTTVAIDGLVDRVVVEKSKRTLTLLHDGRKIAVYRVALGRDPVGRKIMQGDNRTPEGLYFIDYRIRKSAYHRALHLTYPNADDRARADSLGVAPGGDIMIHGLGKKHDWMGGTQHLFDWTNGCIALTDAEIEEIWDVVPLWTPVEIRP